MKTLQYSAVIFDLDGVIVDSMSHHRDAWVQTHNDFGIPFIEEMYDTIEGMGTEQIVHTLFGAETTSTIEKIVEQKKKTFRESFKNNPLVVLGAQQFIEYLLKKEVPIAIATATPKHDMEMVRDTFDWIDAIQTIVLGEEVAHNKPAPDVYLEAARRLSINPTTAIVFEDSIPGIQAGKAAGMTVIGVATTHDANDLHMADFIISNFGDDILRQLF